jgi:hypothetical protein
MRQWIAQPFLRIRSRIGGTSREKIAQGDHRQFLWNKQQR